MTEPSVPSAAAEAGRTHNPGRRELTGTVVAVAAGGGLALLAGARTWSTVTVLRAAPLGPVSADIGGRTLQPAVTGLAVVALAGVLALLATRGVVRQLVGVVLALTGVGTLWRAALGLGSVSVAYGRQLVAGSRTGATLGIVQAVHVTMHPIWALVAVLGGLFVVLGGVVTAARGGRWRAMSSRYESPVGAAPVGTSTGGTATGGTATGGTATRGTATRRTATPTPGTASAGDHVTADDPADEVARARADLALWLQLDRGEDPTAVDPPLGAAEPPPTAADRPPTAARQPPTGS